jgi:hypothetical protein
MDKKAFNGRFVENSKAHLLPISNEGIPIPGPSRRPARAFQARRPMPTGKRKRRRITAPCAKRTIGTARKSAAGSLITIAANEA